MASPCNLGWRLPSWDDSSTALPVSYRICHLARRTRHIQGSTASPGHGRRVVMVVAGCIHDRICLPPVVFPFCALPLHLLRIILGATLGASLPQCCPTPTPFHLGRLSFTPVGTCWASAPYTLPPPGISLAFPLSTTLNPALPPSGYSPAPLAGTAPPGTGPA